MDFWCVVRREKPFAYFPPCFLATAEGELPPGTEQTQEKELRCGDTRTAHRYPVGHRHTPTPGCRRRGPARDAAPAPGGFLHPRPPPPLLPSPLPLASPPLRLLEKQPHLVNKWHVGEVGI